MVQANFAADFL